MKNKQFKAYLRDQQRHHIKRSKRRPVVDETVNAITEDDAATWTTVAKSFVDMSLSMTSFHEAIRVFSGRFVSIDYEPRTPPPWTDSIRYTLEDGKKVLSWKMPYFASAFITEIYYSHIHDRLLFRRGVVESPYVLHDQCTAVGLVLLDSNGEPLSGPGVFPVTKLSEMEAKS